MRESKSLTIKDTYKEYLAHGGTVDFATYSEIVEEFNCEVMDRIIYEGVRFEMGSNLSGISILRIMRTFKKTGVDWKASNENKQKLLAEGRTPKGPETPDGEDWLIFFHDQESYCRFYWNKAACTIRGRGAYQFKATRGLKGNKTKLIEHLKKNPLAELAYEVAKPYVKKT